MRTFYLLAKLAVLATIATACQSTGSGLSTVQLPPSTVADFVEVGARTVPLPPGEWTPIRRIERAGSGWNSQRVILVSRIDNVIDRYVTIMTQQLTTSSSYNLTGSCSGGDFHHSNTRSSRGFSNDCWQVRTLSLGLGGDAHPQNEVMAIYAEENRLFAPLAAIGTRFIITSGPSKLEVEYLWNPDLLTATFDGDPSRPEDWSRIEIEGDPGKRAVIDAIIRWSIDWYPVFTAGKKVS